MSQYDFKRKATFWKNIDCDILKKRSDILKKKSIYEEKANSKKKGIFGQKNLILRKSQI